MLGFRSMRHLFLAIGLLMTAGCERTSRDKVDAAVNQCVAIYHSGSNEFFECMRMRAGVSYEQCQRDYNCEWFGSLEERRLEAVRHTESLRVDEDVIRNMVKREAEEKAKLNIPHGSGR